MSDSAGCIRQMVVPRFARIWLCRMFQRSPRRQGGTEKNKEFGVFSGSSDLSSISCRLKSDGVHTR